MYRGSPLTDDLPEDVKDFIRLHITSIGQLDVLFLLRQDSSRVWSAAQVGAELRTNETLAANQLQELLKTGLIEPVQGFRFTSNIELVEKVTRLAEVYQVRRQSVIHFIYTQPIDRIRDFADAFKIKKE